MVIRIPTYEKHQEKHPMRSLMPKRKLTEIKRADYYHYSSLLVRIEKGLGTIRNMLWRDRV